MRSSQQYVYCGHFPCHVVWLVVNTCHYVLYLTRRGRHCGSAQRYVLLRFADDVNGEARTFRAHVELAVVDHRRVQSRKPIGFGRGVARLNHWSKDHSSGLLPTTLHTSV